VASTPDDRPWEFGDPRRDRAMIPYTDDHTAALIDEATTTLVLMRALKWLGDAGPAITALISLAGQADALVCDAVAHAREQEYTWDQIASRLATTAATAQPPTPTGATPSKQPHPILRINEPAETNDITGRDGRAP
jgi:hypothetical protein